MLTKAQVRTAVRQQIDDPDAAQWSDANLDILIDGVYDNGWQEILHKAPWYKSYVETLSSLTSPGYFAESDLTPPSNGRFNKLQQIIRDNWVYHPVTPERVTIENDQIVARDVAYKSYFQMGDQFWLIPLDTTTDVDVRYNYFPQSFDDLADATVLDWPEGHVWALILESSVRALLKGAREDPGYVMKLAMAHWGDMMADVARRHPSALVPIMNDEPLDWGGMMY